MPQVLSIIGTLMLWRFDTLANINDQQFQKKEKKDAFSRLFWVILFTIFSTISYFWQHDDFPTFFTDFFAS